MTVDALAGTSVPVLPVLLTEPGAEAAARLAARLIAAALRSSLLRTSRASFAVSGGATPKPMFRALADLDVDWSRVHIVQVDERIVNADHPDRNLAALQRDLLDHICTPASVLDLPVTDDLGPAAAALEISLDDWRFDVVHLGLGSDGHSASLFPADANLGRGPIVLTPEHGGHRRVTLSETVLSHAALRVVLCVGAAKREAVNRVLSTDPSVVLSHMEMGSTIVVTDRAAVNSSSAIAEPFVR